MLLREILALSIECSHTQYKTNMPHAVGSIAGKKRKILHDAKESLRTTSKAKRKEIRSNVQDYKDVIQVLENQIVESRKNYNNVAKLLSIYKKAQNGDESITAAVALCRVFCRLMAAGNMAKRKSMSENEITIVDWLKARYAEYTRLLLSMVQEPELTKQHSALTLVMRLVKQEAAKEENVWRAGLFIELLQTLFSHTQSGFARDHFFEKFVNEYDDVRFFVLQSIPHLFKRAEDKKYYAILVEEVLQLLSRIETLPQSSEGITSFWVDTLPPKHGLRSVKAQKKVTEEAWLALLRQSLTTHQRNSILNKVTTHISPIFNHLELLMDFLTSSFDAGGATSLLALSGLFHLITTRNLDYPNFYPKLYSLLDSNILHSKHRSRFFRHLDTFLSSSHLPVVLVASFIKRLSRLALSAPPAGIVAVVPFVYNMLQRHRQCTFMLHREQHPSFLVWQQLASASDETPPEDPFNAEEPDPMKTNALESSLWELDTLRSHYHPNVATLAGIIAQQFTKREYQLEDFLDYSYATLIDAELGKELKKSPVVEWQIPKKIFSAEGEGLGRMGELLEMVRNQGSVDA